MRRWRLPVGGKGVPLHCRELVLAARLGLARYCGDRGAPVLRGMALLLDEVADVVIPVVDQ